jgi:tetratricopeptide (TPR) repeat protein
LAALVALVVYVRTLGPTVTGEDSGELITAAYTLGVAHPPGYPLWTLLAKLFTFIPYGTVAWRVNLMSAVLGAASVYVATLVSLKLAMRRWAAVVAALAFAFIAEYWSQAVIAEVYTLNMLLILLCLFVLLEWYETRRTRLLYTLAFCFGLGMANHNTMMLCGPVFVGFILFIDRDPLLRWRTYAACTTLSLAVALLLYLYLPIGSLRNTPMDWGNPETFENWWDHITRKQYAFAFTANPRSLGRLQGQVWTLLKLYTGEFTPWLAALPLAGGYVLWRKSRIRFGLMLALFLTILLGFTLATNFKLDKESLWVNNVFYVPAYAVAALFLGLAADGVASLHKRLLLPAMALGAACVGALLATNYAECDKSHYYFAHDFGLNVLNTMEENAVYFPTADHATFPALYLQAVEGIRPDITLANKYGYPEECIYKDMPEEQRNGFRKIPTDAEEQFIEDWVIANGHRPVYFTRKRGLFGVPGARMADAGLLYRVVLKDEKWSPADYWSTYRWHTLDPKNTGGDYTAELILGDYWFSQGRMQLAQGKPGEAIADFDRGLAITGDSREGLNNVGSASAEAGQLAAAQKYYARSLAIDPEYDLSLRNLAKVYLQKQEYANALSLFERILAKQPRDPEANLLSVQCLRNVGRLDEALNRSRRTAELIPDNPQAWHDLGYLLEAVGDSRSAQIAFTRSLSLDPNQPDLTARTTQAQVQNPMNAAMPQFPGLAMPNPELAAPQLPDASFTPGAAPGGMPTMPNLPAPPATVPHQQ